jgi:hypothetical protein
MAIFFSLSQPAGLKGKEIIQSKKNSVVESPVIYHKK